MGHQICAPTSPASYVDIHTIIIQAKHTNAYNLLFSESDFYSPESANATLSKEIPRINALRTAGQLDHYMLFSNRRLAGNAESEIRAYIAAECSLPESSVYLCGIEQLESLLRHFPDVPAMAKLDPIDSPLIVSPDDLAEVVSALAGQLTVIEQAQIHPPTPRVSYDTKNVLNNMSAAYAKQQRKLYLKDTQQIATFLAAPENEELMRRYESVAEEFNLKIIARRQDYQSFDRIMEYLVDLLFGRDASLRQHRRLTRTVLFYMYWNCDIGEVSNAEAE